MKRTGLIVLLLLVCAIFAGCTNSSKEESGPASEPKTDTDTKTAEKQKARTVITTDGEVDDMNSVLRYLLYANEMNLEGIVLTSSVYHYAGDKDKGIEPLRWTGTEWLTNMIDAYEDAYPNLEKHADGYPEPDYLRSITKIGNISNVGEMEEETDGSQFLKELFLNDDDSDLYVQTWGGTNTTARALKSIEEEYSKSDDWESVKSKVSDKLVLYIILDQDDSYSKYIAKNWPDIRIINDTSNFWHFAYAWQLHSEELNTKLTGAWHKENIVGHGPLMDMYALMGDGKMIEGELFEEQRGTDEYLEKNPQYNKYDFISEGDSPSFFYLIDNGLRSLENPTYGGWGGRFDAVSSKVYKNTVTDFNVYANRYEAEYSLTRWFDDIQSDFAARADWLTAESYEDANHNPTVEVTEGVDLTVEKGEKVTLHANASDPDGDKLSFKWWRYFEADTYEESKVAKKDTIAEVVDGLQLGLQRELAEGETTDTIELTGKDSDTVSFTVPEDAKSGDTLHVIVEVQDDGAHALKHYQRVILTVK
ncbi:nucleoside hydrolase-like domain-containing protein [Niallia circulans]